MIGISDDKGISSDKLNHIFLGETDGCIVQGYHYDNGKQFGDEKVYVEKKKYPSGLTVIENKLNNITEGIVKDKRTNAKKQKNNGKSTFFSDKWTRQDVVDCIDRCSDPSNLVLSYKGHIVTEKDIRQDPNTKIIIIDCNITSFPVLRL